MTDTTILGVPAWQLATLPLVRLETRLARNEPRNDDDERTLERLHALVTWHVHTYKIHSFLNILPPRVRKEYASYLSNEAVVAAHKLAQNTHSGPTCTYDSDTEHPVCFCHD